MNNAMLSNYSNKIQKFYDKGFTKAEVKVKLEEEKEYYENALFKVNERKKEIESFMTLQDIYNYVPLGYKEEFSTLESFEECMRENGESFDSLISGMMEDLEYQVCDYYNYPSDIMCNRWEVEQRIQVIEHKLINWG